jgi:hypothetical protein
MNLHDDEDVLARRAQTPFAHLSATRSCATIVHAGMAAVKERCEYEIYPLK